MSEQRGRGSVIAWSGTVATVSGGFAGFIASQVKSPMHSQLFLALAVIAMVAFLILIAAGIPDLIAWMRGPLDAISRAIRRPRRLCTSKWMLVEPDNLPSVNQPPWFVTLSGTSKSLKLDEPPHVRLAISIACSPIRSDAADKKLWERFEAFLSQPPVTSIVGSLTDVRSDVSWTRCATGTTDLDAVLTSPGEPKGVASARLVLPYGRKYNWREKHTALLILHVESMAPSGKPAQPARPEVWTERIGAALALPRYLATFLSKQLGARTTGEPPALLAVLLAGRYDIDTIVDISGLQSREKGFREVSAQGWLIGDPDGMSPEDAPKEMVRHMLQDALKTTG